MDTGLGEMGLFSNTHTHISTGWVGTHLASLQNAECCGGAPPPTAITVQSTAQITAVVIDLSLSDWTFTHTLCRMVIIYRGLTQVHWPPWLADMINRWKSKMAVVLSTFGK